MGIKLPYFFSETNAQYFTLSINYRLVEESNTTDTINWRIQKASDKTFTLKNPGNQDNVMYSINLAEAKEAGYISNDGVFKARAYIAHTNYTITARFYITEIKFDIADLAVGDTFSWANYGIATNELSNVTFNGTEVTDLDTFNPTAEAGTLTFTVNKDGYAPMTFTINVA